ncbi:MULTISPECIES: hypothetical protein [unclassified Paenarthrobacter]|uniref:hypothetical protein n=1 Tax=unclassified Paenarthrobacter TaxID=2634190 RepID=UPI00084E5804|nr:hypothetical protein [Paenarthrobacter sp. R1]NKR10632.1 hypothetical protein [Arthrobacter sp. M5]NKR16473.1 hypothetical protein [Arthrobacter sp. M6]OEH61418.1 hypothetical protein A5N13_16875 [Arthrobacter sp. D4]OEH64404.1 hypothetical protein A5N17_06270 [Arthrobacter sp. D2]WIV29185.1 hypothetical protein QN084_12435 [Paenarthrobacter sp. R1]
MGWLGLVPLGIGVDGLIRSLRKRSEVDEGDAVSAVGLPSAAGIIFADGADNIAYTPSFRTMCPKALW